MVRAVTRARDGFTAAQSPRVQSFVRRHGMKLGASRFVAGETHDECIAVLRELNRQGGGRMDTYKL